MAGFILENMLSENGGMTRRICRLDKNGCLVGVKETSNKKLKFTYNIKGNELFVERKEKSITKATILLAYYKAGKQGGGVAGPKKLAVIWVQLITGKKGLCILQ